MNKKLIYFAFIVLFIISCCTIVNGKYGYEHEFDVANIVIYKEKPKITYATHISNTGWIYENSNFDIIGKDSIKNKSVNKIEGLAFNVSGNVPKDFVQVNTYIYTYWGPNSLSKCTTTGHIIKYGYNPDQNQFSSMASNNLVTLNGKKYFQFGGGGLNGIYEKDINGDNPIPGNIYTQCLFGICGINMKLKEYSSYSIVYQILVEDKGWIEPCSDGQECMYSKTKPITAFRTALIPKAEKQSLLNKWKNDVGTFNT